MLQESPILIWTPGGGTPVPSPGVSGNGDVTQLQQGQGFVAVVFDVPQINADWEFYGLFVVNTIDVNPLNIWPGVVTEKSALGFTLQLNGMPDSDNYFLHWTFNGSGGGTLVVFATGYSLL